MRATLRRRSLFLGSPPGYRGADPDVGSFWYEEDRQGSPGKLDSDWHHLAQRSFLGEVTFGASGDYEIEAVLDGPAIARDARPITCDVRLGGDLMTSADAKSHERDSGMTAAHDVFVSAPFRVQAGMYRPIVLTSYCFVDTPGAMNAVDPHAIPYSIHFLFKSPVDADFREFTRNDFNISSGYGPK